MYSFIIGLFAHIMYCVAVIPYLLINLFEICDITDTQTQSEKLVFLCIKKKSAFQILTMSYKEHATVLVQI
jgi:hypothetical protein